MRYWGQMFELITEMQKRLFALMEDQMAGVPGVKEAKAAMAMMPDLRQAQNVINAMQGVVVVRRQRVRVDAEGDGRLREVHAGPAALTAACAEIAGARGRTRTGRAERLLRTLAERLEARRDYMRFITAPYTDEIRLITIDEVCYFQADNKYTRVVTAERESLIRRSIGEIAAAVDPAIFWQIHRSTIVNINAVAGVLREVRGHLRVRLKARKETLAVSERYVHLFTDI